MQVIGLDIGGANLKAADVQQHAASRPFPVWREPERLAGQLRSLIDRFAMPDLIAVTMTAELADCFSTKQEGVERILAAVEESARGVPVAVWQTGAEFVSPAEARELAIFVAAANWHALATWLGRLVPTGNSLLIDIGSTTTDIIPIDDGVPCPEGLTDCARLISGELVYTGVRRTPVCATVPSVPLRNSNCRIAAELFATMLDVHLILGNMSEDANDLDTANGRPATKADARDRLARAVCSDATELSIDEIGAIAAHIAAAQRASIVNAVNSVIDRFDAPCRQLILSGSGTFLAEQAASQIPRIAQLPAIRLQSIFTKDIAEAACAFAVANLAAERVAV